jgi:hypothetical protein
MSVALRAICDVPPCPSSADSPGGEGHPRAEGFAAEERRAKLGQDPDLPGSGATWESEDDAPRSSVAKALRRIRNRAALGCMALAIALSLAAGPAQAAEPANHPFLFEISRFFVGQRLEILEDPCGVALDSHGDIYIADYYHDQVAIFRPDGSYLTRITGIEPAAGACALEVAGDGDLYVESYHHGVFRLTPSEFPPQFDTTYGERLQIDPGPSTGLALDPATGNLLIDERTRIAEREPSGALVRTFGEGQLGSGHGDASTDTVKIFAPSGASAGTIDGAGTPQHGFASLVDAALAVDDSDGHLFVTDNLQSLDFEHPRGALDEFDPAGAYRGGLPEFPTLFAGEPSGLAIDNSGGASQGDVYLTSGNSEGSRLGVYGPTGPAHTLEVAKTGAGEGTVSSEPAGIDCGTACLAEYDAGSTVTLTAAAAPGSALSGWSGCLQPSGSTCVVTLATDHQIGAEFVPAPEPLATRSTFAPAVAPALAPAVTAETAPATLTAPPAIRVRAAGEDSALVEVTPPGAGSVSLTGADLRPISQATSGSVLRLRVRLDRRGARALAADKAGLLGTAVLVTFTPSGGGAPRRAAHRIVFDTNRQGRNR